MNDFLGNLASKALSLAPIIEPRLPSRFEPWRTSGALEVGPLLDRVDADRALPESESEAAVQARRDRPRRESYDRVDEPPHVAALYSARRPEPMLPESPLTLHTVLTSSLVESQMDNRQQNIRETAVPTPNDRTFAASPDPARSSSQAVSAVDRIERVMIATDRGDHHDHAEPERVARERDTRPIAVHPITTDDAVPARSNAAPTAHREAARPSSNIVPIIERVERVMIDRSEADHAAPRPSNTPPIVERIERVIVDYGQADRDHVGLVPVQHVIVEHERSDRSPVVQSNAIQLAAAVPESRTLDTSRTVHPRITPIVERIRGSSVQEQVNRSDTAQTPPAAPPTIQVTIGRIEVRAAPPPAPIKRASPPTSTMSLDDYLRSRSGAGR